MSGVFLHKIYIDLKEGEYKLAVKETVMMWFCKPCRTTDKKNCVKDVEIKKRFSELKKTYGEQMVKWRKEIEDSISVISNRGCDESDVRRIVMEELNRSHGDKLQPAASTPKPKTAIKEQVITEMEDRKK